MESITQRVQAGMLLGGQMPQACLPPLHCTHAADHGSSDSSLQGALSSWRDGRQRTGGSSWQLALGAVKSALNGLGGPLPSAAGAASSSLGVVSLPRPSQRPLPGCCRLPLPSPGAHPQVPTYMPFVVHLVVGQLHPVKADNLAHPGLSGAGGVRVDIEPG